MMTMSANEMEAHFAGTSVEAFEFAQEAIEADLYWLDQNGQPDMPLELRDTVAESDMTDYLR